jgi:benzil reductase ((S)-benzoin forming)
MTKHLYILTGASRGMGLAMAQQLLHTDHHLLCISRQSNDTLAVQAQSTQAALTQWQQDLAEPAQPAARLGIWLGAQRTTPWASLTLINNAGVIADTVPLSAAEPEHLAQALRVGLEAPLLLTAAFLHATDSWTALRRVLNISSGLGRRAMASQAAYGAAKAGMDHFTRCLALEESSKSYGAKVCSLAPGVIDTDMQTQLRAGNDQDFPDRQGFVNLKTNGQLTSPAEAAARVLAYLARTDFGSQPVADVREV